jgi:putative oxidoreductase
MAGRRSCGVSGCAGLVRMARMKHDDDPMRDLALLFGRGLLGASIAAHGAQKLLGWFDGPGLTGAGRFMEGLGFQPGEQHARLASYAEIASGVLIAAGAFGPVGPAILTSVMVTAAVSNHLKNGYFATQNGFELNTIYALAALFLALNDHGRLSFDRVIGLHGRIPPRLGVLIYGGGVGAAIYMLSRRRLQPPQTPQMPRAETGTIGEPAENVIPPNF